MQTYSLTGPALISPHWLNWFRGKHIQTTVTPGGVTVDGVFLRFKGEAPAVGTEVMVWLGHNFVCATCDEIERDAEARRAAAAAAIERDKQKRNAMRAEAEAFNAKIMLPVKWDVGIKDTLSGLSANSWGDGRNARTVEHILLLDPLRAGRLKREAGDFLCTAAKGTNGKRWSGQIIERRTDGDGNEFTPKVTCKVCLKIALRNLGAAGEPS